MNIAVWLERTAQRMGTQTALFVDDTPYATYEVLAQRVAALAAAWQARYGLEKGDRVILFLSNRPEYIEALYAVLWLGCVVVPTNSKLVSADVHWVVSDTEAKLTIVCADTIDRIEPELLHSFNVLLASSKEWHDHARHESGASVQPCASHDLAWLFYTSGTTGKPKGVMLSHANLIAMSLSYLADVDLVTPRDTAYYAAPFSHGAGLYNFVHVLMGARHAFPGTPGFDPEHIIATSKALGEVSFFAAPTMVRRLVRQSRARHYHGDGIKTIVYGGGPMYLADIEEAICQLGQRFVQIYGQGETPMTITALGRQWHRAVHAGRNRNPLTTVGTSQSVVEVRIVDDEGNIMAPEKSGEIQVRGETVMLGYWRDPEATKHTLSEDWLHTGDIGFLDAHGFLTLTDRSKDVIISGGTNIYPREIEEVLIQHPKVTECAVIGVPDAEWGELVAAFVAGSAAPEELDQHCLKHLARFKRPKLYKFFAELPKNANGKIVKRELLTL